MLSVLIWFREEMKLERLEEYLCRKFPWKSQLLGFRVMDNEEPAAEELRSSKQYIGVRIHGTFRLFETSEICYMEKEGREIRIFLESGENYQFYGKFEEVLPALGSGFCRCHKSYVVNLDKVRGIRRYNLSMANGETLPVSQKKYREVKEMLSFACHGTKNIV